LNAQNLFARYEKDKWMVAAEHSRLPVSVVVAVPGAFTNLERLDQQSWYVMATYKVTSKLTAGLYDTQSFNRQAALGPARYLKDWAISGRYDFGQYIYAKAEEHIYDGTQIGYDYTLNPPTAGLPTGLEPNTHLTILKIGVSF
jgi:hypothetical protein